MGFYDSTIHENFGSYSNLDFMDLIDDASVPTLRENASYMELALEGVAQSEENWSNIMKACALTELTHFQETGEEYVYTEATGSGFIASAKAFFKKIWEKIKAVFKKFAVMLGAFTKSGKDFVTKYRVDIASAIKNIPSDAKIKGYKFTIEGFDTEFNQSSSMMASAVDAAANQDLTAKAPKPDENYDYEDVVGQIRGSIIGEKDATASEFSKGLFEMFRGGEGTAEDLDLNAAMVNEAMTELQGIAKTKKATTKAYNTLNKYFDRMEKALTKAQNNLAKGFPKNDKAAAENASNWMINLQRAIAGNRAMSNAAQQMHAAFLTACKDYTNQCKRICVKVVSYKTKHEGYGFQHYNEGAGSFFDQVSLA